jgi:hypothetical protein
LDIQWIVPEKYHAPRTSGLSATVAPGGSTDLAIELHSN